MPFAINFIAVWEIYGVKKNNKYLLSFTILYSEILKHCLNVRQLFGDFTKELRG